MADTVTPNPYSPYATADPERRHTIPIPGLLAAIGVTPIPGTLAITGCGQLAVVPADVALAVVGQTFPAIACTPCVAAFHADRIDEPPRQPEPCNECNRPTPYAGLCILCRQDHHGAWQAEQDVANATILMPTDPAMWQNDLPDDHDHSFTVTQQQVEHDAGVDASLSGDPDYGHDLDSYDEDA